MFEQIAISVASSVVTALIAGGGIAGIIIWISKTWLSERIKQQVKSEYDEKLETLKAKMKYDADLTIEQVRSRLSVTVKEHELRFSKLTEKRADVITETYASLKNLHRSLAEYTSIIEFPNMPSRESRGKAARDYHQKFFDHFLTNDIFLPKATANKINEINKKMALAFNEFHVIIERQEKGRENVDAWNKIFKEVNTNIMSALDELSDDLRRIMGDDG